MRRILLAVILLWRAAALVIVDTRSLNPSVDASTLMAVAAASGLDNRDGANVFVLDDEYALFWLDTLLPNTTSTNMTVTSYLSSSVAKYGAILYTINTPLNVTILPPVITLAGTMSAIPLDERLHTMFPSATIVLDTRRLWPTPESGVLYAAAHAMNQTSSLAFQDGSLIAVGHLVDWIVNQKLFVMYLKDSCLPLTRDNAIVRSLVENSPWERPVRVYGYNSLDIIFGGYLFEAETDCVDIMGQVASANSENLSFWKHVRPFVPGVPQGQLGGPMIQSPSPLIQYDKNTAYVALVYGDMDNIDFVRTFGRQHMQIRAERCSKPGAKCFPLTWTLSPNLVNFGPAILRWYYEQAATTGGRDWFIMPPSGTLYSYPGEMPSPVQANYVAQQNAQAIVMNTTGTIHWEWFTQWRKAWDGYFPRYTNSAVGPGTRGFFLNNVPWKFPIEDYFLDGRTYRWIGNPSAPDSVVGFKPSFNWQEGSSSGGLPYNATMIAGMINKFKPGSIQYIYVIQNTNITSIFEMASMLRPGVQLVGYQQLMDLARQAGE